jgi:hypothetical protein
MLLEISSANEAAKNGKMRDLLAVARGYATGVRANSSTTGAALWTELLTKDTQNRCTLSRAWGLMHNTAETKQLFFDAYEGQPAASGKRRAPTRHNNSSQIRSGANNVQSTPGVGMGGNRTDRHVG